MAWALVGACGWLAACGRHHAGTSQVAAKVNGDEITVHQVDFVLQHRRSQRSEPPEEAEHRALEDLIDEQVAVQRASKLKLDRSPDVVQSIEEARREILARAYFDAMARATPVLTDAHVRQYFEQHPGLFSNRKIYTLQRLVVQPPAGRGDDVLARAQGATSMTDYANWLKAQNLDFTILPQVQPAEALPMNIVEKMATSKIGESVAVSDDQGVALLTLVGAQPAPKSLDQSRPEIEQFLAQQARRNATQETTKTLRDGAKIEYVGQFAASAPAKP